MYYELSKSQKKIARRVMDKGLDNDYQNGLTEASDIIGEWKSGILNNKEGYMKLYESITNTDDILADRYNGKGGSRWVEVMADQFANRVITEEDIFEIDEKVKDIIMTFAGKKGFDE